MGERAGEGSREVSEGKLWGALGESWAPGKCGWALTATVTCQLGKVRVVHVAAVAQPVPKGRKGLKDIKQGGHWRKRGKACDRWSSWQVLLKQRP